MRDDMYKVIVERPRAGRAWAGATAKSARVYRNRDDTPSKIGMKKGQASRKGLNENLSPLKRWLESQVNRPWDKVYGELCANIDRRNTVQEHIFAHIDNFVERDVKVVDGELYVLLYWHSNLSPIGQSRASLYVDPRTGILRKNKLRDRWRREVLESRQAAKLKVKSQRREISATAQLHRLDGIWYHVTLAPLVGSPLLPGSGTALKAAVKSTCWDVVLRKSVSLASADDSGMGTLYRQYGRRYVYAVKKRQLSNAELKHHRLTNDAKENAGFSRRFLLYVASE